MLTLTYGASQNEIARFLQIDTKTLRKHYRRELDHSKAKILIELSNTLLVRAMGGRGDRADPMKADQRAIEYFLSRQGGEAWKAQKQDVQHSSVIGGYDLSKISDDDLEKLEAILGPARLRPPDGEGDKPTALVVEHT